MVSGQREDEFACRVWNFLLAGVLERSIDNSRVDVSELCEAAISNAEQSDAVDLLLSKDGLPLATAVYDANGNLQIPANAVIRGTNYNWKSQQVAQTSVNLQREIASNMLLDVGYLGVRGLHNNHGTNINQAPPQPQGVDYNLARPLASEYPQLGDIQVQFSNAASWYDALTARFVGRFGKGLTLSASYAHGRSFQNGNNINPANLYQYYGPTTQDIAHLFSAQLTYELPVGKGRQFLPNANRALDAVLGGWDYLRSSRFEVVCVLMWRRR